MNSAKREGEEKNEREPLMQEVTRLISMHAYNKPYRHDKDEMEMEKGEIVLRNCSRMRLYGGLWVSKASLKSILCVHQNHHHFPFSD